MERKEFAPRSTGATKDEQGERTERELSPDVLREKMRDPHFLPSREEVFRALPDEMTWLRFCFDEEKPVFEILTEEYVEGLAAYLSERVLSSKSVDERPFRIVEVGAGNGRLSHLLRERMNAALPGRVTVVATDSGRGKISQDFPVEKVDAEEAMTRYNPDMVLCSWMPNKVDMTKAFRDAKSVKEYVLIGEVARCCGACWETWGVSWEDEEEKSVSPYEADGFTQVHLDALSELQLCRTDIASSHNSRTVSFRRSEDGG